MKSLAVGLIRAAACAIMLLAVFWLVLMLMASSMGWGARNSVQIAIFVLFGLFVPVVLTGLCVSQSVVAIDKHRALKAVEWLVAAMLPIPLLYLLFEVGFVF